MIRKTVAVWAGKATGTLSRMTRRGGGTTLPGDIARAIDPKILTRLAQDLTYGSIVITGTNGKTTTARLLSWLLEGAGQRVVANRAGANLICGATAAALNGAGTDGKLKADWGVFEIDEASLPKAVEEIQPRATLVLNLFRDQLDRYGELESIAKKIEQALSAQPETARAILNADDPRVAEIGLNLSHKPLWYGLDDTSVGSTTLPHAADARSGPSSAAATGSSCSPRLPPASTKRCARPWSSRRASTSSSASTTAKLTAPTCRGSGTSISNSSKTTRASSSRPECAPMTWRCA